MIKKCLYRLSGLLLGVATLAGSLTSCQDDEFPYPSGPLTANTIKATLNSNTSSGLVQNEDGTWTATRRVPLVGAGRVLSRISPDLISVGTWTDDAQKVVNIDLEDGFNVGTGIVDADLLANQIISVYDMGHEYAANQKVGFVINDGGSGVLDLDALQGFWLKTYRDSVEVGHYTFMEASSVADLGIGNVAGGNTKKLTLVEAIATEPFDEICLGHGGIVSAGIAQDLEIYYAYVGENPVIPAVNNCSESPISSTYFGDKVGYKEGVDWSSYAGRPSLIKLIDDDLGNGIGIETLSSLFQPYMTVDFGHEVPAGSEVGFYITQGALLNLDIAGTNEITTYDAQGNEADNYTLTRIIGLQLLGGGQSYLSIKTTKPCQFIKIQFWGVKVNLGVMSVHYAFVREKTEVDISSYFNLSDATVYNPTYRFPLPQGLPEGVTIVYNVKDYPDRLGTKPEIHEIKTDGTYKDSYYLSGMNVAGDYIVEASLVQDGKILATCEATITRAVRNQENCTTPLINPKDEEGNITEIYRAYAWDEFHGVDVGGDIQSGDYSDVVDDNTDNYIQATEISVNIATDQQIVGVEKIDKTEPINASINIKGKKIRVGFVINKESDFLQLDVLKFLRIKLYRNNTEVASGVGDDNQGVSLGLIQGGSSTTKKTCLSIETDVDFDQVELYCSGLLGANLGGSIRVFYAYIEDAEDECANPGEECMQLITNGNYGAVASTSTEGLASVGAGASDMANIVDNSIESAAKFVRTVELGTGSYVHVKFDPIKPNQEVGFILSNITGLANLKLIDVLDIAAYRTVDGTRTEVGSTEGETSSGGALSLKVAGKGDYQYVSVTPSGVFDELVLIQGHGVGLLDNCLVHGVYLLPDYDGDGAVDCVDDVATTMIVGLHPEPADICEGESTSIRVNGGVEGAKYLLKFLTEDPNQNRNEPLQVNVTLNSLGRLELEKEKEDYIANLPADEYWLSIANENGETEYSGVKFTVHPNETTWTGAADNQWSNWDNWTRGVPWSCTNVIIPSPSGSPTYEGTISSYPVISSGDNAQCHNIHFEPGAELIGQHYLTLTEDGKAFVDMAIEAGKYQLVSVPLQGMVTGDMFVPGSGNREAWKTWQTSVVTDEHNNEFHPNYFIPINDGTSAANVGGYPEHRTDPTIYQRFWSSTVSNRSTTRAIYDNTEDPVIIHKTDWSRTFNAVATGYGRGQGFVMRVGEEGESLSTPYEFHFPKEYGTYSYFDINGNSTGTTDNVPRTSPGKLMLWTSTIYLERKDEGNLFLFGNPYMAHINIETFLRENSENIARVHVYDASSQGYKEAEKTGQIAPMEAVFVETAANSQYCTINFTEDMFEQGNASGNSYTQIPVEQLSLSVAAHGHTASCSVIPSASASDDYDVREDASLLVGSEEGSGVAVFTVAGGKALSIQRISQATRIPVGFYLREPGSVRLSFQAKDAYWDGWHLTDTRTGQTYPLDAAVTLEDVSTGSGRFFLEKAQ